MKKRKIPFGAITVTEKSRALIKQILETGRFSGGRYVREFEKKFSGLIGTKKAVAVSSGADAVALALAVLYDFGVSRGDEIILPALSFVATGNAVLQAGFTPVFVDVTRETLNINPLLIEQVITEKTRAVLAVHLMGKPAQMDSVGEIARRHNLYVIEDAAEAHGAVYKGKNAGTIGDMAAFSLYVAHIITTVEGGIITTDREDFAEILRSLRSHGRACRCEVCLLNTGSGYCAKRFANDRGADIRFLFDRIGFSAKMNELEAAVGLGNLEIYQQILAKRRQNLNLMRERFRQFSQYLATVEEASDEKIGPHAFPIIVKKGAPFNRGELANHLTRNGIDTRDLFSSMPTQCPGFAFLGYRPGDFPEAEYVGKNGLHIGVHQEIEEADIDYFIETVKKFLKTRIP